MTIVRALPRFREAYRALDVLAARERWSRAEVESYQLERLNATWRHAVAQVPHYRDLAIRRRLPKRFSDLAEFRRVVPVLSKSAVQQRPGWFLSEQAPRGRWRHTSGSTGFRTAVFWGDDAYRQSLRAKYRLLSSWGVDIFDRSVMFWGDGAVGLGPLAGTFVRARRSVEDRLRRRLRLEAHGLGPDRLRSHLRRIERFRPVAIYAYSTAAYMLAREALASGFRCESLKVVILTSEMALPHMVETVERALGVPAVQEYGSVECGFLAGEDPARTLKVREDLVLLETCPRSDGRFDIIATVLNNPAFPLLRYAVGDTTSTAVAPVEEGFAALTEIIGRHNDLLVSRRGDQVHPTFVCHLLEDLPGVTRFRARQRAGGAVHILVEVKGASSSINVAKLRDRLQKVIGFQVHIELVSDLPSMPSGKHRWIVSELAALAVS
jgi:phenylacetate-CoA ligase